jgi:DNA-binding MarR family transcriptional regulator
LALTTWTNSFCHALTEELRQRWSRRTRQLAQDGLIERQTELHRDRVTHVRITALGREHVRPTMRLTDASQTCLQQYAHAVDLALAPIEV